MQTANILLSLGGDHGNTVPKYGVPASEIAVLREIHGAEAVQEIEPAGDIASTHRAEIGRLRAIYGKAQKDACPVERLYPGAAARVFEDLAELELPEEFFKAEARIKAPEPTKKPKPVRKAKAVEADPEPDGEDDGVEDMAPGVLT